MASYGTLLHTMAADVANAATFTTAYPTGTTQASLTGSTGGRMVVNDQDTYVQGATPGFAVSFGASTITITNNTGYTLVAGTPVRFSFGNTARNGSYNLTLGADHEQAKRGDA